VERFHYSRLSQNGPTPPHNVGFKRFTPAQPGLGFHRAGRAASATLLGSALCRFRELSPDQLLAAAGGDSGRSTRFATPLGRSATIQSKPNASGSPIA
jgi:hypothetical protein